MMNDVTREDQYNRLYIGVVFLISILLFYLNGSGWVWVGCFIVIAISKIHTQGDQIIYSIHCLKYGIVYQKNERLGFKRLTWSA